MRKIILGMLAFVASPVAAMDHQPPVEVIEAPVTGPAGSTIGSVTIRGGANATIIRVTINAGSLNPGWHGIHLHAVGDCSDHGKFQLSKGHVNHAAKKHGLLNAEGPDEGDLPNIFAAADGSANAEVSSHVVRVSGHGGLKDSDGAALVIHANEDDHSNQPIGNAGGRVACAVLR
jgi:Cu-Zn family superoxide dismutase